MQMLTHNIVVLELKFGHFYFSWPPLTSATSEEVGWKTLNIVDFDVSLSESINFEHLRH